MPPSCVPSPPTFSTPSRQEGQGTDSWPSSLQYVAWLANSINFHSMTWEGGVCPRPAYPALLPSSPPAVTWSAVLSQLRRVLSRVLPAAIHMLAHHTRPPRALTTSLRPSATRYVHALAPVEERSCELSYCGWVGSPLPPGSTSATPVPPMRPGWSFLSVYSHECTCVPVTPALRAHGQHRHGLRRPGTCKLAHRYKNGPCSQWSLSGSTGPIISIVAHPLWRPHPCFQTRPFPPAANVHVGLPHSPSASAAHPVTVLGDQVRARLCKDANH
jgi:hypothetical protein